MIVDYLWQRPSASRPAHAMERDPGGGGVRHTAGPNAWHRTRDKSSTRAAADCVLHRPCKGMIFLQTPALAAYNQPKESPDSIEVNFARRDACP